MGAEKKDLSAGKVISMKKPSEFSKDELKNLINNYRRLQRTQDAYYSELLQEFSLRSGSGLDFETTKKAVLEAAKEQRFLSYKQLADASGADWVKVHYAMNTHLGDLVEYAHYKGWPLLSAIIVNQKNVETGDMDPSTLKGFVTVARELGYSVVDEVAFLKEEQQKVFKWASQASEQQR
ncbi:hypothetical protein [Cohaesibacter marisflavi]|uniref:hypothetical protein n=1 Tax=Cohaesibacter marisflavi TaxID=655353 RepID=UPI0029C7F658|nr:hypothetical protein [Cohaesibacter marisflavi]